MTTLKKITSSLRDHRPTEQRPCIVLTRGDREKLFALINSLSATKSSTSTGFLREEIARAEIASDHVAPTLVVRMGSYVKFIDHEYWRVHCAKLVFPEEAHGPRCVSVLSSVGMALIGLGPGQSIYWNELGRKRGLSVLEVFEDEGTARSQHRKQSPG